MSETVKDRAHKFYSTYWQNKEIKDYVVLLTEFGEAERKRAVNECEEAVRKAWRFSGPLAYVADATDNLGEIEAALRALVAPPVLVWCEHCLFTTHWRCKVSSKHDAPLEHWHNFCPICGKPKPKVK